MRPPPTALAALGRTAIDAAGHAGVDVDDLLQRASLSLSTLQELDGRIESSALFRLWELAAEDSGDPFFGLHVGERLVSAKTIHVVGYVARNCQTLGACYERTERFGRLTNEASEITLRIEGERAIMRVGPLPDTKPWPRCYSEMAIAAYMSLGRRWCGVTFDVLGATFQHSAPADASEYVRLFGTATFDAPKNELILPASVLALPLLEPDPALGEYLALRASVLLENLQRTSGNEFENLVRTKIDEELGEGAASLEGVARRLAMSARTLQRRLGEANLTFSALVDDVRKAMALGLIENPKLSIFEIAAMVGYQDAPSFRSAFMRWTGMTPRDYRRERTR